MFHVGCFVKNFMSFGDVFEGKKWEATAAVLEILTIFLYSFAKNIAWFITYTKNRVEW